MSREGRTCPPRSPSPIARGRTARTVTRQRLSGERGLVEDGLVPRDDAVRGHDLPCADDDDVARPELVDADLLDRAARVAMGRRAERARRGDGAHVARARPPTPRARRLPTSSGRRSPPRGTGRARGPRRSRRARSHRPRRRRGEASARWRRRGGRGRRPPRQPTRGRRPTRFPPSQRTAPATIDPSATTGSPLSRSCRTCSGTKAVSSMATSSWRRCEAAAGRPGCGRRPRRPRREGRSPG